MTTHQPGCLRDLYQLIGYRRIDRRHSADIEDKYLRARLRDHAERFFHDVCGAHRIENPNERKQEDALPDRCHRGRHHLDGTIEFVSHTLRFACGT